MSLIKFELRNRVAYLTLNRPEKRNALNHAFVTEIKKAVRRVNDDAQCKVAVLKSEGEAFCAGADLEYLKSLQSNTYEENLADSTHLMELFRMIYLSPKIFISQVEGPALAGGCGLATICDFSFAVPEAKFGYTEVKIGFIPAIVKVFLIRKIGEGKAREILLSGNIFDSAKAKDYGLINFIEDPAQIGASVQSFAEKLSMETSGQSVAMIKEMMSEVQQLPLDEALNYAARMNAQARATEDCQKGISSFLNKERISW